MEAATGGTHLRAREHRGSPAATRSKETLGTVSPSEPPEDTNPGSTWSPTSGLQNCDNIDFSRSKPPSWW